MSKKNDLSAYKATGTTKNVLVDQQAQSAQRLELEAVKRVGRPKVAEKRTWKVTLSFTEREGKILEQKAGLTPVATLIMAALKETDLLE